MNKDCSKCPNLVKVRQNIVFGNGPVPCDVMYIARNPGRTEDRYGKPLIGTAGNMASDLLAMAGMQRETVFLTNAVKCYTPSDRPPYESEIESCREYLEEEILEVKPKVIIATGRECIATFAPYLTDEYKDIEISVRGPVKDIRGIPFRVNIKGFKTVVVPTFHPSFVSRMQHITKKDAKKGIYNAKPVAVMDLLLAKRILKHGWKKTDTKFELFCERIEIGERDFSFDLETTGLNPQSDRILGHAVSHDGKCGQSSTNTADLQIHLESRAGKITQNGTFDYRFAKAAGIKYDFDPTRDFDTMLAAHALAPDLPVNLGFINSLYVHLQPWKPKTKGKMHDTTGMDQRLLHERCCLDAISTFRAGVVLEKDLRAAGLYESPFRRLYIPMIPILVDMELNGVKFRRDRCDKLITHLFPKFKALQDKWISEDIDIGSNKQVGTFLKKQGAEMRYTEKGNIRVDEESLSLIDHPLAHERVYYKKLEKLLSTDLIGMRKQIGDDGMIRTHWDLTGTGTGRFSSIEPDLQNIRLAMRHMFVARDGHYLYGADYKGMELDTAALLAGDTEILQEMIDGRDVHEEMRKLIYGLKPNDEILAKTQRRIAKSFVFGPLYGKTKFSIARDLHISQFDSERYLSASCTQRPKFVEWRDLQSELAYGSGGVYSSFGRRRLLFADRVSTQAYNSPVQMTAHDVVLESMILTYQNLNIVPWLQVHDSLIWEIPGDPHHPNEKLESEINEILTRPIPELNNHRFRIDTGRGYDWKQIDIGLEDAE